ncbi:MAG: hypothetical protein SW833_26175 [Cyanobacteriota bacterium]|nr:hypothetical protein [Cyanobacteriota bacterium]
MGASKFSLTSQLRVSHHLLPSIALNIILPRESCKLAIASGTIRSRLM